MSNYRPNTGRHVLQSLPQPARSLLRHCLRLIFENSWRHISRRVSDHFGVRHRKERSRDEEWPGSDSGDVQETVSPFPSPSRRYLARGVSHVQNQFRAPWRSLLVSSCKCMCFTHSLSLFLIDCGCGTIVWRSRKSVTYHS